VGDPLGEVLRQHAQTPSDLQHDVLRCELGRAVDHPEDVRVDQEVLSQLAVGAHGEAVQPSQAGLDGSLGAGAHHQPNTRAALRSTVAPSSCALTPRRAARKATVWATKAGWLRCPRTAWGDRYGASVSASLFPLLRVSPQLGRSFSADDEKPGAHQIVILSHGLWERRFGGDPGLLGKSIRIDDAQFGVVGIMPPGFFFPNQKIELWEPFAIDPNSRMAGRSMHILDVIGRLRPGVRLEQARAEMGTLAARLEQAYPRENTGHGADVFLLLDDWTSSQTPPAERVA